MVIFSNRTVKARSDPFRIAPAGSRTERLIQSSVRRVTPQVRSEPIVSVERLGTQLIREPLSTPFRIAPAGSRTERLIQSSVRRVTPQAGTTVLDTRAQVTRGLGTPSVRQGGAQSGIAAGGTALARGAPAIGAASVGGAAPVGELSFAGIGDEISSIGGGIMNTVTQYLPLAIKIVIAVIIIKIVLFLVRGRR